MIDFAKLQGHDEQFYKAVRVVAVSQRADRSEIQLCTALGYTRSQQLLEEMMEAGIVTGSKVNLTIEEWEAFERKMQ